MAWNCARDEKSKHAYHISKINKVLKVKEKVERKI
jgi:hypothetical protein